MPRIFIPRRAIFSKLDTDQYIPTPWRLTQFAVADVAEPEHFPVFIKPEWGQNAQLVQVVHSQMAIRCHSRQAMPHTRNAIPFFIAQHAAIGTQEFDIFLYQNR